MELRFLFCAYCLHINALYLYKFCQSISKGFRVTDPDVRVDTRVVASVDVQMDIQTDRKLDPYITP